MDYHEMYENWISGDMPYDPDYPIDNGYRKKEDDNKPVDPDDWAKEDFEGGF